MKTLTIRDQSRPIYDIVFSESFDGLANACIPLRLKDRKICIVSESRVAGLYMEEMKALLRPCAREVIDFVFPEGEESKNLSTVQMLYERLKMCIRDRLYGVKQ